MKEKYWILRKVALIFKVFAWIAATLGVVFCVIILVGGGTPEAPRATSLLALLLGFFYLVFFYMIAEVLRVLMDIEENTRKT
jgi:Zn-dependent protease with chaperone function